MRFENPLQRGTLLRRYKRFLADIRTESGSRITSHCPNTGAMLGCSQPGSTVYFSRSDSESRKYPHTLELVESENRHLVCVNTSVANKVIGEALSARKIEPLSEYQEWQPEIGIPDSNGRFDFGIDLEVYVEVKSVTFLSKAHGRFPDAKSDRATKHVRALQRRIQAGQRGVLLFCVPHTGIEQVGIARDIDPTYYESVACAVEQGMEVLAFRCSVSPESVAVDYQIPFTLD